MNKITIKKLQKLGLLLIVCLSYLGSYGQTATAPSGDGTSANPYQIATLENLYWISQNSGEWGSGKHYIQTADIDATATSTWFSGEGFPTIATTPYFYGVYDGNGKIISNLHMDRSSGSYGGLFGIVSGANAVIKDLGLVNLNYSFETGTTGSYVGGIVARPVTDSKIERCFTTGNITHSGGTNSATGGIAGWGSTRPSITESWSSVHINSTSPNNDRFIGGIIGWLATGSVEDCYYTGSLNWSSNNTRVGGIIGFLNAYSGPADISRCYSIADFIGSAGTRKGAVVGRTVAEASASDGVFFDNDLISLDGIGEINTQYGSFNGSIDGKSTSDMKTQSNYPAWDFTQIWGIDPTINDGYPHLLQNLPYNPCNNFAAEAPTLDNGVYQISTFNHLRWISENSSSWGADFIQTADIDAVITSDNCYNSGEGWLPIGNSTTKFSGSYDGDGHTISNLFINRPNEQRIALFGETNGATIQNLGLIDPDITVTGTGQFGMGSNVGSLVGFAGATDIAQCFAAGGSVTAGGAGVGGLIGQLSNSSSLTDSFAIVAVEGGDANQSNFSAGLVGVNSSSTITNCYAAGSVVFKQYAGFSTVSRGLTQNNAGTITNSFYDRDATGQTTGGGTAQTTVEMQQQATFTNWDFQCEAANGTANIWGIDEGNDYPRLSWEGFVQTCPPPLFASGDGSEGDPYQIANWTHLSNVSNFLDAHFILTNNIDENTSDYISVGDDWTPIGDNANPFTGLFDGQGNTLSDLIVPSVIYDANNSVVGIATTSDNIGLFGSSLNASIKNLTIQKADVGSSGQNIGILIGKAENTSVENVYVDGLAWGHRAETLNPITIKTDRTARVGGLIGYAIGCTITDINVDADVFGDEVDLSGTLVADAIGGLIGEASNCSISNASLVGLVLGREMIGGLLGGVSDNAQTTIATSSSTINVTGVEKVGGLLGGSNNAVVQMNNSYATGSVHSTSTSSDPQTGGLLGEVNSSTTINNCYAIGAVSVSRVGWLGGGLVGKSGATINNSFWNHTINSTLQGTGGENTNLPTDPVGLVGKTTEELQKTTPYLEANWNYKEVWKINQTDNNGYPFLALENFTPDNVWLGEISSDLSNSLNWSEASVPTPTSAIRIPSKAASNNMNLEVDEDFEIATLFIENEDGNLVVLPTKSIKVNGNITNNGQIIFKSDATGDAYFDAFTGSISGTGNVVIEKFYPAKRAFRMVTFPVDGGSIFDNWQNGGADEAGIGTHITGDNTGTVGQHNTTTGIDYTGSGNPSLFSFYDGWQPLTDTKAAPLQAGIPLRLMVRGDRSIDLTDNDASPNATTLTSTGDLQVGGTDIDFHKATTTGTNPTAFAFIANPYQSRIDVSEVLAANPNTDSNQLWVWDPMINDRGAFVTIDELTGNGDTTPSSNATKFIEPGQAFFIQLSSISSSSKISFTESVKDVTTTITTSQSISNNQMSMLLSLQNEESQIIDGIRLRFAADGISKVDAADIAKMSNIDENLASVNQNSLFSIQRRNFPENEEEIPLFTNNWRKESYSFVANLNNFGTTEVYLVDAYLGKETLLEDGKAYTFEVDDTIPESKDSKRFALKFGNVTLSVADEESQLFSLYPNPADEVVNIQTNLALGTQVDVEIYNLLGQQVYAKQQELKSATFQVDVNTLNSGIYMVKLTDEAGHQHTHKLIKK